MKKFIRLVNFEFERMSKFLFILIGCLASIQLLGSVVHSRNYMERANDLMRSQGYSVEDTRLILNGAYSHARFLNSFWFLLPVAFVMVGLFFYTFFIWYREWWAKNTFAYRLLMLPINRMSLFFSKLFVLLVALGTLLVVQLGLVFGTEAITSSLVSADFYIDASVNQMIYDSVLSIFIPSDWMQFLYSYSLGTMVIMVLFTSILIERSLGGKGWLFAGLYGISFLTVTFGSLLINSWYPIAHEFFTSEVYGITFFTVTGFTLLSLFISYRLLTKKITI